jgi:hypothetical protein
MLQPDIPLGTPIEDSGKAAVMALANSGQPPKFSKYSGVVQWENGFFLWVNLSGSSESTGREDMYYPNIFLEGGKYLTWFGSSIMRPGKSIFYRGDRIKLLCHLCLLTLNATLT